MSDSEDNSSDTLTVASDAFEEDIFDDEREDFENLKENDDVKEMEIEIEEETKSVSENTFSGGVVKSDGSDILNFLRSQKNKMQQAQKQDQSNKIDYSQLYKDNVSKKLETNLITIDIKTVEQLQEYHHLCMLTKYEVPRLVMFCKQYFQDTGIKNYGNQLFVQRVCDDCDENTRIQLNIPISLFKNYGKIKLELEDYYLSISRE